MPIGHISLDSKNKDAERLDLDIPTEGVFWIKTFFVRQSLQSRGIGRAAMDEVESMAIREPLWARTLMLDTIQRDDQMREDFAKATYGTVPKVRAFMSCLYLDSYLRLQVTNEDWYGRRGYRPIGTVLNYYDVRDRSGMKWDMTTIFMRKDIL